MKAVPVTLLGHTYYLLYNGAAMFACNDAFGAGKILECIAPNDLEGYEAQCKAVVILAEQGELSRRYYGYDSSEMLTAERLKLETSPVELLAMKQALMKAVLLGYGREIGEDDDQTIDLGLAELNKKKANS